MERKKKILSNFKKICTSKNLKDFFNEDLLEEVVNIVDDPNVLFIEFNKIYVDIIISFGIYKYILLNSIKYI